MSLSEGLLILVVIILVCMVVRGKRSSRMHSKVRAWDCIDRDSGELTSVKMRYSSPDNDKLAPEKMAASSNLEYFEGCGSPVDKAALDTMCTNDDFSYAVNDFGANGASYSDWVASQAVDPAVLKNHAEFVQDRLENQQQWATSSAYSPDSHDSYDPIPWSGLMRPQSVPVCNPTQVPDVDVNLYAKCQKLRWTSSGDC